MEREMLANLIDRGLSTTQIATELGRHPRIVTGWLQEHGLQTHEDVRRRQDRIEAGSRRTGVCRHHGEVEFVARGDGSYRCVRCRSDAVSESRRRRKAKLVSEAGGCCVICGYDRCVSALEFHHIDPSTKRYGIGHRGAARSLASMRAEAAKCVLLCSNCHAEVESGLVELPIQ